MTAVLGRPTMSCRSVAKSALLTSCASTSTLPSVSAVPHTAMPTITAASSSSQDTLTLVLTKGKPSGLHWQCAHTMALQQDVT